MSKPPDWQTSGWQAQVYALRVGFVKGLFLTKTGLLEYSACTTIQALKGEMTSRRRVRYKFSTGLFPVDQVPYSQGPYKGKNWHFTLEEHSIRETGMAEGSEEVVIHAPSLISAFKVGRLINAAYHVVTGEPPSLLDDVRLLPYDRALQEELKKDLATWETLPFQTGMSTSHFPLACLVAAKASLRRNHVYALLKFLLSSHLHSNHMVDLDPTGHTGHLGMSQHPYDHVRFAHSILASYSAIEELGLEIRASKEKPSFVSGKWNPEVQKDLEKRLTKAGIDINEPVLWQLRGTPTTIERKRRPRPLRKARYIIGYGGFYVRDKEVRVIDAVADVSWFRDKISAHTLGELAESLTPYDVDNARSLARRLILEKLGFWPPFDPDLWSKKKSRKPQS